ncbi:MAG: BolA family transcriptional regulator [Chromatiales bacterium]|nr:BolA family transcriptional regulator [Chromatiales bacterium]
MEIETVRNMIESGLPGSSATVTGDGAHFDAIVVSEAFESMNTLKRQRAVFATLGDSITSGALHALNIKAYTPEEWKTQTVQ